MITSNATPLAIMRDLADKLNKRFAGNSGINGSRQAFDANGMPLLFLSHNGNEAEGQSVILIRIEQIDAVSKDIFGNSLNAYAPHLLQFAYEKNSAGAPIPSAHDLDTAKFESIKTGVKYELVEIANGSAVTEANLNTAAASPVVDLDELYWPTKLV